MWLAARAEGIGMGWVSLFEPESLKQLFKMPPDSDPKAILCLGQVAEFYRQPLLESEQWAERKSLQTLLFENSWANPCR
jgi:5,6-dimethylbenzimidazole synthase